MQFGEIYFADCKEYQARRRINQIKVNFYLIVILIPKSSCLRIVNNDTNSRSNLKSVLITNRQAASRTVNAPAGSAIAFVGDVLEINGRFLVFAEAVAAAQVE